MHFVPAHTAVLHRLGGSCQAAKRKRRFGWDGIYSQLWPSLADDVCSGWAERLRPASLMG